MLGREILNFFTVLVLYDSNVLCRLKKAGAVDDPFLELTGLHAPPPKPQGAPLKPGAQSASSQQASDPFSGAAQPCPAVVRGHLITGTLMSACNA